MGFPSVSVTMPKCFGFKFLPILFSCFKIVFNGLLNHLNLLKPPEQAYIPEETTNYVLVIDRFCPTPVPVPVNILTAIIKKRLPVAKFSSILKKLEKHDDEECMCPVCLDSVRKRDQIRLLCNCSHVFHKECLDKWVDEGQVTCPLCRSMLFPDNILVRPGGDPWIMESGGDSVAHF